MARSCFKNWPGTASISVKVCAVCRMLHVYIVLMNFTGVIDWVSCSDWFWVQLILWLQPVFSISHLSSVKRWWVNIVVSEVGERTEVAIHLPTSQIDKYSMGMGRFSLPAGTGHPVLGQMQRQKRSNIQQVCDNIEWLMCACFYWSVKVGLTCETTYLPPHTHTTPQFILLIIHSFRPPYFCGS